MAYLEGIKQRQEQLLDRNSLWISLLAALFLIGLLFIVIDIFEAWSLLGF